MKLKAFIKIIGPYKGRSKHSFFKILNVGDIIQVSTTIKSTTGASNGIYATNIKLENETNVGEPYIASMSNMVNTLQRMSYEEITS